jgi:hypothetical protein
MSKDLRNILIALSILLLLLVGAFIVGWKTHSKYRPCPTITSDTILIHDTITHTIVDSFPYYVATLDTIFFPDTILQSIDTAKILKNYFATFIYNREWKDSLVNVTIEDYISQNRPIHNNFSYKILRPQTIINNNIDNSITYNRYFQVGISDQINDYKNLSLNAQFIMPKWYVEYEYIPNINTHTIGVGVTVFKLRKVK